MRILVMLMTRTMRSVFVFPLLVSSVSSPSSRGIVSVDIQDEKEAAELDDLEEEERLSVFVDVDVLCTHLCIICIEYFIFLKCIV